VGCQADCTIEGGGGAIVDSGGIGVITLRGRIHISNVTISGNEGKYAIGSDVLKRTRLTLSNVHVLYNSNFGVFGTRIEASDSVVTGHRVSGLEAQRKALVDGCTLSFNGRVGAGARTARATDSTFEGNGAEFGGGGVSSRKARLTGCTVIDNYGPGLYAERTARASDSTITGNGVDPSCGVSRVCADVHSGLFPKLSNVACDTSAVQPTDGAATGETWGVCALD
jgi:hypothetical protein